MNHTSKHGSEIIKHKAYKTEIKIVLQNDNKTKQKKKLTKKTAIWLQPLPFSVWCFIELYSYTS